MRLDGISRQRVLDLIANDTSGLLQGHVSNERPLSSKSSIRERNFLEIVDFVKGTNRLPEARGHSILEHGLANRLAVARRSEDFNEFLRGLDLTETFIEILRADPTKATEEKPSDRFNLLANRGGEEIFTLTNVKKTEKLNPLTMPHRVRCLNFFEYESIFSSVHADLSSGMRKLVEFSPEHFSPGSFFVLSGVLGYMAEANIAKIDQDFVSGTRERADGRTLCIFDNETESRMLFRSLVKALKTDGFLISEPSKAANPTRLLTDRDQSMGYVYVLKSLNPKLGGYKNLHKIGFTSGLVSSRIANSEREATYLFSRVRVAATYRCYNINAASVETQLHRAFESVRLDFEIKDASGATFHPREWFQVEIEDIERSIELVQANSLESHRYDPKFGFIEIAQASSGPEFLPS